MSFWSEENKTDGYRTSLGVCSDTLDTITITKIDPTWIRSAPISIYMLSNPSNASDLRFIIEEEELLGNRSVAQSIKFQLLLQYFLMHVSILPCGSAQESKVSEFCQPGKIFELALEPSYINIYIDSLSPTQRKISDCIVKVDAMIWFNEQTQRYYRGLDNSFLCQLETSHKCMLEREEYYKLVIRLTEHNYQILENIDDDGMVRTSQFYSNIELLTNALDTLIGKCQFKENQDICVRKRQKTETLEWVRRWCKELLSLFIMTGGQSSSTYTDLQRPFSENWPMLKDYYASSKCVYLASSPSAQSPSSEGKKIAFPRMVLPYVSFHLEVVLPVIDTYFNFGTEFCSFLLRDSKTLGRLSQQSVEDSIESLFECYCAGKRCVPLLKKHVYCFLILKGFHLEKIFIRESAQTITKYLKIATNIPGHVLEIFYEKICTQPFYRAIAIPIGN